MRLFITAFLGQVGEPILQDRALWQSPPQCSICTAKFVIYQHIGLSHNPQALSVAGGDFVGWGNPLPTRQIIPWAKTSGGDEFCIYECWWHIFPLKQIWRGQKTWLMGPVGKSGFIAQGWGPGQQWRVTRGDRSSPWTDFYATKQMMKVHFKEDSVECNAGLKCFEESTICEWWVLVKKDTRENQEKHGSNFLDKRQSSLHGKHVKGCRKKKNHHSKISVGLDSPGLSPCSLKKLSLLIPQMLYFLNSQKMYVPAYHSN